MGRGVFEGFSSQNDPFWKDLAGKSIRIYANLPGDGVEKSFHSAGWDPLETTAAHLNASGEGCPVHIQELDAPLTQEIS